MPTPNFTVSAIALAALQTCAAAAAAVVDTAPMAEVVVSGARVAPGHASVAGFADTPLLQTPASVSVLTSQQMADRDIRSTTDAARYDATLSDAYNAVGYSEQFSIRGFKLDNANSYRKDGMAISGDTQIPMENKERLEVLKGTAGLQAGVASPGGMVNYVVKRPTSAPLRSVLLEERERGTLYGAVDLGGRFDDTRFGYRVNVAAERLRSYIKGADGNRKFASAAFDVQLSPQALLQLDADYQTKSQVSAPGFQLIGGTSLPQIAADNMLNNQPWSRPVDTTSSNLGLRFSYQLSQDWHASFSANQHRFRRDDYTAFPYGCGAENLYPGFCANGDYDVYDYISLGEKKSPLAAQAMLQGSFATGALRHALTAGADFKKNTEEWGDYVYDYAGTSNIYHPVVVPPVARSSGAVSERRRSNERSLFVQDIVALSDTLALHAGARRVQLKRDEYIAADQPFVHTDRGFWLPSVALVYSPTAALSYYGNYGQSLQYGSIAPIGSSNALQALDAVKGKQLEAGAKAQLGKDVQVTAAVFQIRQGLDYLDAGNTWVRNGQDQHRGVELTVNGKATRELSVGVSATALNTRASGTGTDIDGKRVTNVAAFKSSVYAEYAVQQLPGLKLNANWQYSGKKAFDLPNQVMVPSYHVLNLGASYATHVGATAATFRAHLDNALDKFYWRDVTPDLGGYLFPGAKRTFRVSAQFDL